jgi:hypothetical protein
VRVWPSRDILPRVPMGWGSSITGDSTKDALYFPLKVINAFVAMVSNSSGMQDGEGFGFGWILFWFGDRSDGQGCWHGRGSWS